MSNELTPAQLLVQEAELLDIQAKVVQLLSLQPDTSLAHNVQATQYPKGGLVVHLPPTRPSHTDIYAYCLPWSRGWSIFVSTDPAAGSYSWREVTNPLYKVMQYPVYAPRNRPGPHLVAPHRIAEAFVRAIDNLNTIKARRKEPS